MHMPWSVVTKALMEMGRVSLAERVLHCISFPSPEFEIQARAFACSAFLMRRVTIVKEDIGWELQIEQPEEERKENISEIYPESSSVLSLSDSDMVVKEEEEEARRHTLETRAATNELCEKPYYPRLALASLPPRAGVLRTALYPEHKNWHLTKSRMELKAESPCAYEKKRPPIRKAPPVMSLRSPSKMKKGKKKNSQKRRRNKTDSWITPYGTMSSESMKKIQQKRSKTNSKSKTNS